MVARSEDDKKPGFGEMLGDTLHGYAMDMMSNHLGTIVYGKGWTPRQVRTASPAIGEILREEVPNVSRIGSTNAVKAMDDGFGSFSAVLWCIPYLGLGEYVAATICDKGE